ncbi:unnamed protein product [Moneuplotes crassus]|uniref:E2F/DP family winged-helix DNA-binding domain-containing protein n=1 Tax=Euplotes crassus TaxID=5936 RepID=A0AAD1X9X5_EUPCR|nr:unnamed protein product [Moneuplotes crassus]
MSREDIKDGTTAKPLQKKAKRAKKSKGKSTPKNSKKGKSDKKLVALSRKVLVCLKSRKESTGTEIAYQIMDILAKEEGKKLDFKNVQRRVYDALNVFSALNIVKKSKNKVSITEHGLEYLKKDGSTIPIKLEPVKQPVKSPVNQRVMSDDMKALQTKVDKKMESIQHRRNLIKEKALQMFLLKKLVVKNCSEQFNILGDTKKVKLPFILCKLDKDTEYDVSVGDDRKSLMINSELIPSFYNDNHVLAELHDIKNNLKENEVKEMLGNTCYNQVRAALYKDKISKILVPKKSESKMTIPQRNLTKKSEGELQLQCKEKTIIDSSIDTPSKISQSKMSKREKKAMRKRLLSPNFDKENHSILNMNEIKEEEINSRRENLSQFNTPLRGEANNSSILDKMLYKNCFDSCDSKSPIHLSMYEEKDFEQDIAPITKFLGSHRNILAEDYESEIGGEVKFEANELSPLQDNFRNIWRSCIDSDEKKHISKISHQPRELEKMPAKRSACKDFSNLNSNYSPINENNFLSPTKDLCLSRGMISSPFMVKSPLLKAIPALSKVLNNHRDIFDDDITKAENSNLFSNKSNQIQ